MKTEGIDRARVFGERPEAVERIAPDFFDSWFVAEHVARYKWASQWVRGRLVLDVACGTGYGASILRAAGAEMVISLDVSRDALQFGCSRYSIIPTCCDAQCLPLNTSSCDAVVSLETIEHLPDPIAFVRELKRVLRGGGELLITTPNAVRSPGTNPYHLTEMTIDELRGILDSEGFHVTGIWGQHWKLPPGIWHRIKGLRALLYRIEQLPMVTTLARIGMAPYYWCIRATKPYASAKV